MEERKAGRSEDWKRGKRWNATRWDPCGNSIAVINHVP